MSIEAIAAQAAGADPAAQTKVVELASAMPQQAGPATTGKFENALASAESQRVGEASDVPPAVKNMLTMLDKVNGEAKSVADYARTAEASGAELTPGEVVQLTMRAQEFMFHAQLSSNIANRTSDGIQQLFRQQS